MGPFKCPSCGRESYNINDIEHKYCGGCKRFYDETGQAFERMRQDIAHKSGITPREQGIEG